MLFSYHVNVQGYVVHMNEFFLSETIYIFLFFLPFSHISEPVHESVYNKIYYYHFWNYFTKLSNDTCVLLWKNISYEVFENKIFATYPVHNHSYYLKQKAQKQNHIFHVLIYCSMSKNDIFFFSIINWFLSIIYTLLRRILSCKYFLSLRKNTAGCY